MTLVFPAPHIFLMSNLNAKVREILRPTLGLNLILTVGNRYRSDDGVGPYIGSKLTSKENLLVINAESNPENIIDQVIDAKPITIIVIDAADFGGKAGEIRIIDKEQIPEMSISTHTIPMSVIASIFEKDTSATLRFIGIQPRNVALGEEICSEVKDSALEIIKEIKEAYNA